jgi:peptide/nickel transport system substrate-binding protein
VFVEHKKGERWQARRWEKYFQPGKPYLDGYEAQFMAPAAVIKALESGRIMAEFRGVTPSQRDQLAETAGDRITTTESPWLSNLLVVFNTNKKPFEDARVRRALSLAIDRWGAAERLQGTTFLKYVGGLCVQAPIWRCQKRSSRHCRVSRAILSQRAPRRNNSSPKPVSTSSR